MVALGAQGVHVRIVVVLVRVRIRGRTGGVARVAEEVGRAPEELHTGLSHPLTGVVDHRLEVGPGLREVPALRGDVAVVEAEVGDAHLVEELEGGVELGPPGRQRIQPGAEPGPVERAGAEHVLTGRSERMPHAHGDPEVVLHALAEDEPIGLVDLVRQRIARLEAAEGDPGCHFREEALCHWSVLHPPDAQLRAVCNT